MLPARLACGSATPPPCLPARSCFCGHPAGVGLPLGAVAPAGRLPRGGRPGGRLADVHVGGRHAARRVARPRRRVPHGASSAPARASAVQHSGPPEGRQARPARPRMSLCSPLLHLRPLHTVSPRRSLSSRRPCPQRSAPPPRPARPSSCLTLPAPSGGVPLQQQQEVYCTAHACRGRRRSEGGAAACCPAALNRAPKCRLLRPRDAPCITPPPWCSPPHRRYACQVGQHCSGGMLVKVTVT